MNIHGPHNYSEANRAGRRRHKACTCWSWAVACGVVALSTGGAYRAAQLVKHCCRLSFSWICLLPFVRIWHAHHKFYLSVLTAVLPDGPTGRLASKNVSFLDFVGAKGDRGGGDNWSYKTCKAPVKSSSPTNQHQTVYSLAAVPVAQPTVSKHWMEILGKRKLQESPKFCADCCNSCTMLLSSRKVRDLEDHWTESSALSLSSASDPFCCCYDQTRCGAGRVHAARTTSLLVFKGSVLNRPAVNTDRVSGKCMHWTVSFI